MRLRSGTTDQYIYFVTVDATDLATRVDTGLNFVAKRSRNGGAWATFTTPTINSTDTGGDGIWELLLDEDTTIDAGDFTQEMVIHIEDTGGRVAPVTRIIELFRSDTGGIADATWAKDSRALTSFAFDTGIWASNSARTLTAFAHDTGIADTVWKSSQSAYTDTGSLGYGVNVSYLRTDTGAAQHLAQLADEYDTGRLPAEATATLDTGGIHQAVWQVPSGNANRTLTNIDTGAAIHLAQMADEHDTGRLQAEASATLDTGAVNQAVWQADAARALTIFNHDTGIAQTVWRESTSTYTSDTGSVAYAQGRLMAAHADTGAIHLVSGRLAATDSGIVKAILDTGKMAGAVWTSHATRTLTAFAFDTGVQQKLDRMDTGLSETIDRTLAKVDTGIANDVWSNASRSLTVFAHDTGIAQTIWRESESTYTDTGSMGYAQGRLQKVHSDTGAADIVNGKLNVHIVDTGIYALINRFDTGSQETVDRIYAKTDTGISAEISLVNTNVLNKLDTGVPVSVWQESESTYTDTGSMGYAQGRLQKVHGDTGAADIVGGRLNVQAIDTGIYALVNRFDTGITETTDRIIQKIDTGVGINDTGLYALINRFDTGINSRVTQLSNKADTGIPASVWQESNSSYTDTGSFGYGVNIHYVRTDTGAAANMLHAFQDTGKLDVDVVSIGDTGTINVNVTSLDSDTGAADRLGKFAQALSAAGLIDTGILAGTQAGTIDANITYVNETAVQGTGDTGISDPWRPA